MDLFGVSQAVEVRSEGLGAVFPWTLSPAAPAAALAGSMRSTAMG